MTKSKNAQLCPCSSRKKFEHCCGPYIAGTVPAPDALTLMRSRYTAYTLEDEAYLLKTWHVTTRPAEVTEQHQVKWIGLTVVSHDQKGRTATVEFVASFKVNGRAMNMRELSRFVFENGQWFYVNGDALN